jgi:hypothetical protein
MTFASQSSLSFPALVTWIGAGFVVLGCDGPGICALERVYGVRATVIGGADVPASQGAQGGAGGATTSSDSSDAGAGGEGNSSATCLATVTATDGRYTEQLECSVDKADCICLGLTDLDGEFSLRAELAGREETKTVRVRPEGCSVSTQQVTFFGK